MECSIRHTRRTLDSRENLSPPLITSIKRPITSMTYIFAIFLIYELRAPRFDTITYHLTLHNEQKLTTDGKIDCLAPKKGVTRSNFSDASSFRSLQFVFPAM